MPGGASAIYQNVLEQFPKHLVVETEPWTKNVSFTLSTILFQSVALYMIPYTFQYVYTGASEEIVRRNQLIMPLYMFMYPFVILAGFYGLLTIHGLKNPGRSIFNAAQYNDSVLGDGRNCRRHGTVRYPGVGGRSFAVGGLFTKNILGFFRPNASQQELINWNRVVTASALIISVLLDSILAAAHAWGNQYELFRYRPVLPRRNGDPLLEAGDQMGGWRRSGGRNHLRNRLCFLRLCALWLQ